MATTYTNRSYNEPYLVGTAAPGLIVRTAVVDLDSLTGDTSYAFIINDVIKLFKIPPYAKIVDGFVGSADDLDDHATPTLELNLQITDGSTTKTLVDQGVWAGSATLTRAGAAPATEDAINYVTTDNDFYAQLKAIAASAGDAATTSEIDVMVAYTMNLEPGEYPG